MDNRYINYSLAMTVLQILSLVDIYHGMGIYETSHDSFEGNLF